jgi:hypothetical protein
MGPGMCKNKEMISILFESMHATNAIAESFPHTFGIDAVFFVFTFSKV